MSSLDMASHDILDEATLRRVRPGPRRVAAEELQLARMPPPKVFGRATSRWSSWKARRCGHDGGGDASVSAHIVVLPMPSRPAASGCSTTSSVDAPRQLPTPKLQLSTSQRSTSANPFAFQRAAPARRIWELANWKLEVDEFHRECLPAGMDSIRLRHYLSQSPLSTRAVHRTARSSSVTYVGSS